MMNQPQEQLEIQPLKSLYKYLQSLVEKRMWLQIMIALVFGMAAGAALGPDTGWVNPGFAMPLINWVALPGGLFIRLIQMIMIPLVVSSVITGIAGQQNNEYLKSTGTKVAMYFLATSVVVVSVSLVLAMVVQPGKNMAGKITLPVAKMTTVNDSDVATSSARPAIPDMLIDLLPANPLASMVTGEMLSIVMFSVVVGIALINIPVKTANPILSLLFSIQEICMTITRWAMKIAPVAVFGLICQITAMVGLKTIGGLGWYVFTVVLALAVLVLFYVLLLVFFAHANIRKFFIDVKELLLLAFSTASSAAVMPMSLKTAEEKLGVDPRVSRFIVPVGTTVNMDGTAAYQAVSTVFLAQVYGLELSIGMLILLTFTTIAASIGTPSAPGAGVIVLASVLASVNIPAEGIAIIIGVDRLLGMLRTSVNVMGDMVACMIFNRSYLNGMEDLVPKIDSTGVT